MKIIMDYVSDPKIIMNLFKEAGESDSKEMWQWKQSSESNKIWRC